MNKPKEINGLIDKARESLTAARQMLDAGHAGFAASRAYYAMFYAAQAALLCKDLQFGKHSAVLAHFNKTFVKQGVFSPERFKEFRNAFDLRAQGDYGLEPIPFEEVEGLLSQAQNFIGDVVEYLCETGYDGIK